MGEEVEPARFTKLDLEDIRQALSERAGELSRYATWIDDRPMLPDRELAISRVKEDSQRALHLAYEIVKGIKA